MLINSTNKISLKTVLFSTVMIFFVMVFAFNSNVNFHVESKIVNPLNFSVRDYLNMSPVLDDKLKVYVFDDPTYSVIKKADLDILEWAKVLKTIANNKPKIILIDKIFRKVSDSQTKIKQAFEIFASIDVPIVTGAFITKSKIINAGEVSLKHDQYNIKKYLKDKNLSTDQTPDNLLQMLGSYVYGADRIMDKYFDSQGHILLGKYSRVAPFIKINEKQIIPHFSLLAAENITIKDKALFVNKLEIPISSDGYININLSNPKEYFKASYSILPLYQRAIKGMKTSIVKEGDVVLFIPQAFTGNTDFKETPFGATLGGFLHVAMLNSVITGKWLRSLAASEVLILICILLGAVIAVYFKLLIFVLILSVVSFLIIVIGLYFFSYHGIIVPWFYMLCGFIINAVLALMIKIRSQEEYTQMLSLAFDGAISNRAMSELTKSDHVIDLNTKETVLTLVFVDIVGFSLIAENLSPRKAFMQLKNLLREMSELIHKYDGIVDKTLGDGLLAYFGYNIESGLSANDHAEKALLCSIEIQKKSLELNKIAKNNNEPVYPLRIGMNTSLCYLGDLGTGSRIDYTVVGNGVNLAKRYEASCEMYKILLGHTTYEILDKSMFNAKAFKEKNISIKHHENAVLTIEYDPFVDKISEDVNLINTFSTTRKIILSDSGGNSLVNPNEQYIICKSDYGECFIVSCSERTINIIIPCVLERKAKLFLNFKDLANQDNLKQFNFLEKIECEVLWQYSDNEHNVHSIKLLNLNSNQEHIILDIIKNNKNL